MSNPFQPGMIGGATGRPDSKSTGPGMPTEMPHTGTSGVRASTSSIIASAVSSVSAGPRAMSHARWVCSRMSPSSIATPTWMCSAPSAHTMMRPRLPRKRSVRGARPPDDGPNSPSSR